MENLTYADQIDTTGRDSWPWFQDPSEDEPKVKVIDGEPLVRVSDSKGNEYYETIENLWALRAQSVYENGGFTEIARNVFTLRALRGNRLISNLWENAGYKNVKRALRDTKVLREFSPMLKTEKLNVARKTLKPKIEFVIRDFACYWVLHVNGLDTPIKQAEWNDDAGLTELATLALDSDYCLTWSALENPNKVVELKEANALKERQTQVYKFFQNAYLPSDDSNFYKILSNYRREIENAADQIFPRVLVDAQQRTSYVYCQVSTGQRGIFNPKTKGSYTTLIKELSSSISGTYGRVLDETTADREALAKFLEQEAISWAAFKAEIQAEGNLILVELPTPMRANTFSEPLRNCVLVKDLEAYNQYLSCQGNPEKLYDMVASKAKEASKNS